MTLLVLHHPSLPSRHVPQCFLRRPLPSPPGTVTLQAVLFPTVLGTRRIRRVAPLSVQQHLDALSGSDPNGEGRTHLPAVRSFENDLSRLTVVGPVAVNQAITAAAADGGDAAEEHLASGTATMVVETVFPGRVGEHSTVSTRLILPAKKVREKAKRLRIRLGSDFSSEFSSRNILARTFRQVVLQKLWTFELLLYPPGSERDMEDLANPREMQEQFTIGSSEERILAALAEVVCACALKNVEEEFFRTAGGTAPHSMFASFQKPVWTVSSDSSVSICRLSKSEVIQIAKRKAKAFNVSKRMPTDRKREARHKWWLRPTYSGTDKIEFPGCTDWINEHVPIYRIHVDTSKLKDAKFDGWHTPYPVENMLEALLTHSQLVELSNILDMFFEDRYTMPGKNLICHWVSRSSYVCRDKTSFWKTAIMSLAFGFVLVFFSILARLYSSQLFKAKISFQKRTLVSTTDKDYCQIQSLDAVEMEYLCTSVIQKIKNALDRPEDVMVHRTFGVWMGELPVSLRREKCTGVQPIVYNNKMASASQMPIAFNEKEATISETDETRQTNTSASENMGMEVTSTQYIASYQVSLVGEGEIIGFQPTNRVAVNTWAANPLANILYGGAKLSPGLFEPNLKISRPKCMVVLELLVSVKPEPWFVLARPVERS